jgi:opacity protein-like surface antigen
MKRLSLKILAVIIAVGFAVPLKAQLNQSESRVGTTAGQFLKIGAGARAIAMGGAYNALSDDIYSVYWNPAGIAKATPTSQFAFNHADWLADMTYDFAAAAMDIGGLGTIFASFTMLQTPDEKVRTFKDPQGDGRYWDANYLAVGAGYSRNLTDRFSIGFHFKYIREAIWNESASGVALDIGTLYRTPFEGLMIGASISNFGSKMQLSGRDIKFNYDPNDNESSGPNNIGSTYEMEEFDLPLTFRIGLSMDLLETRYFRLTGAVDATHPNDNTEYVNSGLEFAYDETFFIRGGFKQLFMKNNEGGLTLGAGVKYPVTDDMRVSFNYGFADYGRLEYVHFFDVGLSM